MENCKYERIFCAEQINVPPNLPVILKELTKEVIRANPTSGMEPAEGNLLDYKLYEFCYKFFSSKVAEREAAAVNTDQS